MKLKISFLVLPLLFLAFLVNAQTPEQQLEKLGLSLPEVGIPIANYVKWR